MKFTELDNVKRKKMLKQLTVKNCKLGDKEYTPRVNSLNQFYVKALRLQREYIVYENKFVDRNLVKQSFDLSIKNLAKAEKAKDDSSVLADIDSDFILKQTGLVIRYFSVRKYF